MISSPQTTINFLATHFDFFVDLFKFAKDKNFFIDSEVLANRCYSQNINIEKLEAFKIATPLANGSYELNKNFMDFISFLLNDFRLDLPESIKKYQYAIKEIYTQITLDNLTTNKQKTTNQIIALSNGLIDELKNFKSQIFANKEQLFTEAMLISQNNAQLDYTDKIKKASFLIENYIKPLNDILSTEYSDSFVKLLSQIRDFANLQSNEQDNLAFRNQFEKLYQYILELNHSILKTSSVMAKEVTPLLDRLRTDSQIMKGVETFLLHAKRQKITAVANLFSLKSKQSRKPYTISFEISAKNVFEILKKQAPVNLAQLPDTATPDFWIFDKETYKQKLLKALPIDNFFDWCYRSLYQDHESNINSEKFYYISSLLFEKEIQADFLNPSYKFEIQLTDYILTVPVVKINRQYHEN